jgi:hypothetical protein
MNEKLTCKCADCSKGPTNGLRRVHDLAKRWWLGETGLAILPVGDRVQAWLAYGLGMTQDAWLEKVRS